MPSLGILPLLGYKPAYMFSKLIVAVLVCGIGGSWAEAQESATCLLPDRQQQNLILTDGPKALKAEATSECFKHIVRDEMALLKEGSSPFADDREYAVQSLMQSALKRYSFDKTQAE